VKNKAFRLQRSLVQVIVLKQFPYLEMLLCFSLNEFPITTTSEKAMANAPTIGFKKPRAAMGMATIL
jgi:hypothetical protein